MSNEPTEAGTWEDCAQHLEKGGVVEYGDGDDWYDDHKEASFYRYRSEAPGTAGWRPRRLVPILTHKPEVTHPTSQPFSAVPYQPTHQSAIHLYLIADVRRTDAVVLAHVTDAATAQAVAAVLSAHATEYDQRVADAEYPFGF